MKVNVSSVNDFMVCRFRWWAKWVMNRVPVATSPALDAGRLLHRIFERHFRGEDIVAVARAECAAFRVLIPSSHPASQPSAYKAVEQIEDLIEALPLWADKFPVDTVLEVEEPYEWEDPYLEGLIWLLRPDRMVVSSGRIWHTQNRGLASGMNFGMYLQLAKRHYHEHLYAEAEMHKYRSLAKKKKWKYGGTVFNLVRKLKFRTNVGKANEKVKTADEMFFQGAMAINLNSPLHKSVMLSLRQHVVEMQRTMKEWEQQKLIPAPNEKMNGGYGGNSEDPYFKVLIGEVKLSDPNVFKDREDTYAGVEEPESV